MASKSKKKRRRVKRRATTQPASPEPSRSGLPEHAGWGTFLILVLPASVAGWFIINPFYSATVAVVQRCLVAVALGIVLSALLTYVVNRVLQRIGRLRRARQ